MIPSPACVHHVCKLGDAQSSAVVLLLCSVTDVDELSVLGDHEVVLLGQELETFDCLITQI